MVWSARYMGCIAHHDNMVVFCYIYCGWELTIVAWEMLHNEPSQLPSTSYVHEAISSAGAYMHERGIGCVCQMMRQEHNFIPSPGLPLPQLCYYSLKRTGVEAYTCVVYLRYGQTSISRNASVMLRHLAGMLRRGWCWYGPLPHPPTKHANNPHLGQP